MPPFSIPPLEKIDNIYLTWQSKPTVCTVTDVLYCCWCWRQEKDNATLYYTTLKGDMLHLSGCKLFLQVWLAHLPSHRPELTFAPHPDAEITPSAGRQAAGSHISPISLHWGAAGQTTETAAKIWLSGHAQGCASFESLIETLIISTNNIHLSVCLILSIIRGHSAAFSVNHFFPIPVLSNELHLAPYTHFHWLVSALSLHWLQMRFCRWSRIHSHPVILHRPWPSLIWSPPFSLSANPVLRDCK